MKKIVQLFLLINILLSNSFCLNKKEAIAIKAIFPLANQLKPVSLNYTLISLGLSSGTLSPTFSSGVNAYTTTVLNSISSVTITPTVTDSDATVTVNSISVISGTASGAISLLVGSNTVNVVVTGKDGGTNTYTIIVTRSATLSTDNTLSAFSLSSGTLSPSFSSATISYTASVFDASSSITVTPTANSTASTITVNGSAVTSGNTSGSIALSTGTNVITIIVTAEDSSTRTYTVTVTRQPSTVRRMFVTATSYNGNLGGIAGADAKCNADANKPATGTYKAMLQDDNGGSRNALANTDWVLAATTTYVRSSDAVTIFTTNASRIFSYGTASGSFDSGAQKKVWTGIRTTWAVESDVCGNLSSTSAGSNSRVGSTDSLTNTSLDDTIRLTCDQFGYILCVEQ